MLFNAFVLNVLNAIGFSGATNRLLVVTVCLRDLHSNILDIRMYTDRNMICLFHILVLFSSVFITNSLPLNGDTEWNLDQEQGRFANTLTYNQTI